jgi:hypothetical protein
VAGHLNGFANVVRKWLIDDIINDIKKRKVYFLNELDTYLPKYSIQ